MSKKIRSDSLLGTLPPERQAQIAEFAQAPGNSLEKTKEWLAADGIKVATSNISRWLSNWCLRQAFSQAESSATEFRDWLAVKFPQMDAAELDKRAAAMFQAKAMECGDAETFLAFSTARHKAEMDKARHQLREQQVQLDARRVALLEKKAAQADEAKQVIESKLTPEQQQLKLRQIFGMS